MPVYVYRCDQCESQFEKRQSFSDAPLTDCERCHGALRKVFSPAAIIYKGSGFYSTDHNGKSGGSDRNGSADNSEGAEKSNGTDKPASETKETAKSASSSEG